MAPEAILPPTDRLVEHRGGWRRPLFAAVALAASIAVFLGAIRGCSTPTLRLDSSEVVMAEAVRGRFADEIRVLGSVLPETTVYLDATEGGIVASRYVDDGMVVEAGARLLELRNTNLELELMEREGEMMREANALASARLEIEQYRAHLAEVGVDLLVEEQRAASRLKRKLALLEQELISLEQFEEAELDYRSLKERMALQRDAAEREKKLREERLRQLERSVSRLASNLALLEKKKAGLIVRAPIGGRLTALGAEVGEAKGPGDRLGQIDVESRFKVRAEIDEHYIDRVRVGTLGWFSSGQAEVPVAVSKVFPQVVEGKMEVEFEMDEAASVDLRRGQTLHLRLQIGEDAPDAILVPRGAFFQATGGNWIFVLDASKSSASRRQIRVGRQNTEYFEILEGLGAGEWVLTSSYDGLAGFERIVLAGG